MSNEYSNPDVLVSTDWVAQHLNDPKIRLVESNEDVLLYDTGHIPGAVNIDWHADLNDSGRRDYINAEQFAALSQPQRHHARIPRLSSMVTRTTGGRPMRFGSSNSLVTPTPRS